MEPLDRIGGLQEMASAGCDGFNEFAELNRDARASDFASFQIPVSGKVFPN